VAAPRSFAGAAAGIRKPAAAGWESRLDIFFLAAGLCGDELWRLPSRTLSGLGFFAFALCLVVLFQHPVRKLLRAPASLFRVEGRHEHLAERLIKTHHSSGAGGVLWFCRLELKISGAFTILPMRHADVRAEVEGIIQEI